MVEKVLKSLLKKFDMVVTTIEGRKKLAYFSIEEFIGSLLNHETRIIRHSDSLENAFQYQASISTGRGQGNTSRGGREKGCSRLGNKPIEEE